MEWDLKYGELVNDQDFFNNCENLKEKLQEIQKVLDELLPYKKHYDKMSKPAQIELDLFLCFTLNSLYWINLRIQGIDPTTHPIKDELNRIKAMMMRWQQVKDRQKRPTVNIEAAKRFVRSGLYDPSMTTGNPQNKKTKFDEDSD